jgi:16S rRNA (adenine1518-N6/adenine1519-N6)-dimethyltransferase
MLQKEVALRLTAKAGARSYGRLSIMAQRQAHISYKFEVNAASFSPQPKVQSAVIRFQPIDDKKNPEIDVYFEKIVRLAFATRRKTLANSLKSLIPTDVIKQAEIDPKSRAENLTIAEYERLALKTLEVLGH